MIVVFGGTGKVGRQIVQQLRNDGHAVRVVTRDPSLAGVAGKAEIVTGDLRDRQSLVRAVTGASAIVCTAHGGNGRRNNGPRGIEGAGIPSLIRLAQDTAIEHFVYLSTASAHSDSPVEFFRRKFEAERTLRASGLPFSILRPTHLMDTWVEMLAASIMKNGKALVPGSGANPVSWVAATDVARVAAALTTRRGQGWSADLGGPEALTLTKVNQLIAASLGTSIKSITRMPAGLLRPMSTLTRPFSPVLARQMQMGALLDTQPQVIDSSAAWALYGQPLSLATWLEHNTPAVTKGL